MPQNKGRGGKNFRRGKKENSQTSRELVMKKEEMDYAWVEKALGSGRFQLKTVGDEQLKLGEICGKMRNRIWVNVGDLVLVGLRDFDKTKCDIVHKYNNDEVKQLQKLKEVDERDNVDDNNNLIEYQGDSDDEDEKKQDDKGGNNFLQNQKEVPNQNKKIQEQFFGKTTKEEDEVDNKKKKDASDDDVDIDDL